MEGVKMGLTPGQALNCKDCKNTEICKLYSKALKLNHSEVKSILPVVGYSQTIGPDSNQTGHLDNAATIMTSAYQDLACKWLPTVCGGFLPKEKSSLEDVPVKECSDCVTFHECSAFMRHGFGLCYRFKERLTCRTCNRLHRVCFPSFFKNRICQDHTELHNG
jgi:hypothetical protein